MFHLSCSLTRDIHLATLLFFVPLTPLLLITAFPFFSFNFLRIKFGTAGNNTRSDVWQNVHDQLVGFFHPFQSRTRDVGVDGEGRFTSRANSCREARKSRKSASDVSSASSMRVVFNRSISTSPPPFNSTTASLTSCAEISQPQILILTPLRVHVSLADSIRRVEMK